MHGFVKDIGKIVIALMASLLLFAVLFTQAGQGFLWDAASNAIEDQWRRSSMNNGYDRTMAYEEQFDRLESIEFSY